MSAPAPSSRSPESYEQLLSPVLRSAWLLRSCVVVAIGASALGLVVVPGLRSNASDAVVIRWERISSIAGMATAVLLAGLITIGAFDVSRAPRMPSAPRSAMLSLGALALALGLASSLHELPAFAAVPMMLGTSVAAIIASSMGLRAPHTRAPALVLGVIGAASIMRFVAWELANAGSDRPNLFTAGRVFATIAMALVGISQMAAAAWLGARGRGWGQLFTALALGVAFAMVWGAAKGSSSDASTWQAVLHTALTDSVTPRAYGMDALRAFLTIASMTLAAGAILVRRQVVVVTSTLALALLGRGALDVPMCALATIAASMWLVLATGDDRAMWTDLISTREDRLAE